MKDFTRGQLGYRFEFENRDRLAATGDEPRLLMHKFSDSFPVFNAQANPLDVYNVVDQGQVGSCQGNALAGVFAACYYLATRRQEVFSRSCGYYMAQQKDGLRGDVGSTLSGGQWVATEHGMCLDKDWPYVGRYSPAKPSGINFPFKLKNTKPMKTVSEVMGWLDLGLPIQIGVSWDSFADREVVEQFTPSNGSGGHSTFFWLRSGENARNINSWGAGWSGDGVHFWTPRAIEQALQHRWTVMIGYSPDEMSFPTPQVI